jgi:predicted nucleotidyltransferase
METGEYQRFTEELRRRLEADGRVVGLVALGSMARRDYAPDAFSDHDFFVVTRPGAQEHFRQQTGWVPEAEGLVLWMRETAHGVKALLESGHLLEFAVFSAEELHLARVNRYRVLLDRGGVEERLAEVARHTAQQGAPDDGWLMGQFLSQLLIGTGRHARGERLSGHSRVKEDALRHLVRLLARHARSEHAALLDELDPVRRFERVFPRLGQALNEALAQETPQAALRLLDLAERELKEPLAAGFPTRAFSAVRARLASPAYRGEPLHG